MMSAGGSVSLVVDELEEAAEAVAGSRSTCSFRVSRGENRSRQMGHSCCTRWSRHLSRGVSEIRSIEDNGTGCSLLAKDMATRDGMGYIGPGGVTLETDVARRAWAEYEHDDRERKGLVKDPLGDLEQKEGPTREAERI